MPTSILFLGATLAFRVAGTPAPQQPASARMQVVQSFLLDSAKSALDAGRTEDAVRMAERYTSRNDRDARGFVVLGEAYFKRMPAGRFQALRAFEEALRLAPADPEPAYLYAKVGIWLGGDDGEAIARRGLERVLELDPLYRDAWQLWLLTFRNAGTRRRLRDHLEAFDSIPVVSGRVAYLDIEDELYEPANRRLERLLATDSGNVEWLAWRAQSAYEAGDAETGALYYTRALAHAALDSAEALWRQVVGIARPEEIRAWSRIGAGQRGAWLTAFWARRNPNLFGTRNGRIAEHFQRLRYARRNYPLQHPLVSYHRSQLARVLNPEPSRRELDWYQRCEQIEPPRQPSPGAPGEEGARPNQGAITSPPGGEGVVAGVTFFDRAIFVPLNMDLRSADTTAARIGFNLATGLDDRGIVYLRFGRSGTLSSGGRNLSAPGCMTADVERWAYPGIGEIRFARPSAFARGERTVSEMVFRSMNGGQFEAMKIGITRDETSEPAPLDFGIWTAQFAGGRAGTTEIAVISTRGELAAALSGAAGEGDVRRSPGGVVMLEADPGRHILIAHARDSAGLGRQQLRLVARVFTGGPGLSDLLLAPAWTATRILRWDMLRHVQRTLVFADGQAMRVYAEVYGLADEGGAFAWRAEYALLRTDNAARDMARERWEGALELGFDREALSAPGLAREVLDITPERLPPGNYVLRLTVTDKRTNIAAGRSQIAFAVR